VLGKWLSTFRLIPWLALGPGILALALAFSPYLLDRLRPHPWFHNPWVREDHPLSPEERLYACWVLIVTILAHGAAMTSIAP